MSKKAKPTLEDVFEFPKADSEINASHLKEDKCCKDKKPNKRDPEFEKDVNDYLSEVKKAVETEKETHRVSENRSVRETAKRKNNVSEEGRKQMLANLKKGRETRKLNLNKMHEMRQQELKAEIDEVKSLLKATIKYESKPIETKQPEIKKDEVKLSERLVEAQPVVIAPVVVQKPYIIHSTFKRPAW